MNNLPSEIQQKQTLTQQQQALRLPKDTVISVQEIDELTPSSGDRDAAAKQK